MNSFPSVPHHHLLATHGYGGILTAAPSPAPSPSTVIDENPLTPLEP
jgi:hypothetical protein